VIPLIREGQFPPFDTAPMGTIIYSRARQEKWEAAKAELKRAAEEALKPGYTVSNPITMAIGQEKASQSGDSLAILVEAQGRAIADLQRRSGARKAYPHANKVIRAWLENSGRDSPDLAKVRKKLDEVQRPLTRAEIAELLGEDVARMVDDAEDLIG
jgi:hypothetical protein